MTSWELEAACPLEGFKSFYLRLFNLKIKIITIKVKLQHIKSETSAPHEADVLEPYFPRESGASPHSTQSGLRSL